MQEEILTEKIPIMMKIAIAFNIIGILLLSISLFAKSPIHLIFTMMPGPAFLSAGFMLWIVMIFKEARQKGLLR